MCGLGLGPIFWPLECVEIKPDKQHASNEFWRVQRKISIEF